MEIVYVISVFLCVCYLDSDKMLNFKIFWRELLVMRVERYSILFFCILNNFSFLKIKVMVIRLGYWDECF